MRKITLLVLAAVLSAGIFASCTGEKETAGTSDLYLLEELETARSLEDADKRIERLEIFAGLHPDHPYRALAYESIMETMAVGKGDMEGALAYFDELMEKENDPAIRGKLLFSKFEFFWEADSMQSVALAKDVIESGETDFRLLMYMGYYLMGAEGQEEVADAVFSKLIKVTRDEHRKNHARTIYAEFLEADGREDEAIEVLELASSYTFANAPLGSRLWDEEKYEEALAKYIYLAAGAPGYRKYIKLDSLYATVHPEPNDLDARVAALRIVDGPQVPDREFVDIRGMSHSIAGYRGSKVVITAFSPT
jgi:tetratricopeptide (TPR) repeat protein